MRNPRPLPHPARLALWLLGLACWLTAPRASAANIAPDYPLVEKPFGQEIAAAPLIVEATVSAAGSFQAVVKVDLVYKNALPAGVAVPDSLRVAGFNSIAGDRASRAMRDGDRVILYLQPAGDLYFTPRVGGGRFLIEAATEYGEAKVVASLGDPLLLVPLDPDHFRAAIRAVVARQALAADDDLPPEADRSAAAKTHRDGWQQAVTQGIALAKTGIQSGNPARQYFGVVLARSLTALELADELTELSESGNARLQAESLEALAVLIGRYGFDHPRFDRAALLRSARAGLRASSLRTRLAAVAALERMPADGVARDLMIFYRDQAPDYLALKSGDEKRAQFLQQRSRFWLSPALLQDPAAEATLLDFAASNDYNTATGALGVLGLRGSAASLPGLVRLLNEPDFKYLDDAKVALFRIALSDEMLKTGGDPQSWAAAAAQAQKRSPAERLKAGMARVDELLKTPGGAVGASDAYQRGLLLASCLPGELSLPKMVTQTSVPPGDLLPVVFARTQSPLAYPYLARALLVGDDNAKIQAELALRGWAELEPLVQFGCDSEIGLLASEQTRFGDNPGLDAAAELLGPDVAWGVTAGLALDSTTRYRSRRVQILQAYHGQSFGWGEYELDWNTTLWRWATLRTWADRRGPPPLPPAIAAWLAGARERQAAARTAENIQQWAVGLADADPLTARGNWRQLLIAGLTVAPPEDNQIASSQRAQVIAATWAQTAADRPLPARLLAVNLLGQLRAPFEPDIVSLLAADAPQALRQQAWYALGRLQFPAGSPPPARNQACQAVCRLAQDRAQTGADAFERVLAVWSLRQVPGAPATLTPLLDNPDLPATVHRAAVAALLYAIVNGAPDQAPAAINDLTQLNNPLSEESERLALAAIGTTLGSESDSHRAARIRFLTHTLSAATADTYDIPAELLRIELNPQPYMPLSRYRLDKDSLQRLRNGLRTAFTAAATDPEITLGDNAARGFGWSYATGAWPGDEFNDLQKQAIDPLGRWPQPRARTVAYALEGLARAEAAVAVRPLRALAMNDDDRVAGYASLMLARLRQPDDLVDIFNRFNNAVPKTATWFNTIGATGSADGYKFLTETMKTTGHEAWLATGALGYFDSAAARAKLTQIGADPRQSNATAAMFGWARQLQTHPAHAVALTQGDAAAQRLLCDAVEWLPPPQVTAAILDAVFALLEAKESAVRERADLALARLTGQPPWANGGDPLPAEKRHDSAELQAYWRKFLYPEPRK